MSLYTNCTNPFLTNHSIQTVAFSLIHTIHTVLCHCSKDDNSNTRLAEETQGIWKLSEMGEISSILGMKVTRNRATRTAWVTQPAYIDRLLERFPQHLTYRTKAAPLLEIAEDDSKPTPLTPYQEIIGCLQWLAGCTRPDISFAASYLARYIANPTGDHWELALRTTSYLAQTRTVGLTLGGPNQVTLTGWVNADWARLSRYEAINNRLPIQDQQLANCLEFKKATNSRNIDN
jgi:hypothetical protein